MIAFSCSHCTKKMHAKEVFAGKQARCPYCGGVNLIPARAAVSLADRPKPVNDDTLGEGGSAAPPAETLSPRPTAGVDPAHLDILEPSQTVKELGRLGGYRVLKVLGAGGMGVVFLADDIGLERLVALKAMKPALAVSESARQRFLREARATAKIKHDHIVVIHQVGEARGAPFLAMEFLEGESLDDRLKREGKLPLPEVLRIGREVADGLAAAHEHGLIHRDIKPGNLWLEGKRGRVKILDFGLARATADDQQQLTQSGAIVGTPAYMAPEQAQAEKVDSRCDLFSLGCVLYRLSTGELPFKGKDQMSMLLALAMTDPVPPHKINPDVPPDLSALILRLLAKDREQRPASAAAVVAALQSLETGPTVVQPPSSSALPSPPVLRRKRRWRPVVAAAVAAGLLVTAGLTLGLVLLLWPKKDIVLGGEQVVLDTHPAPLDKPVWKGASDEWVRHVSAMAPEAQVEAVSQKMKEVNTGFDGKLTPEYDKTGAVWTVTLVADDVTDLTPLRALTGLSRVDCNGSAPGKSKLADLNGLQALKLAGLDCAHTQVANLSPLKGSKLTRLNLTGTPVADLTPLEGMPLAHLWVNNTNVAELKPLKGMHLAFLDIRNSKVTDLSPLKDVQVTDLCCDFEPARDTEVLRLLAMLKTINGTPAAGLLNAPPPKDADFDAWLRGVLARNPAERDALVFNKMHELNPDFKGTMQRGPTEFKFNSAGVTNLAPLQAYPDLKNLHCNGPSQLADLSPLRGLNLTALDCNFTAVSDLAPLKDMPLTMLFLHGTPVTDLSPLRHRPLKTLDCVGTRVTDLSPLADTPLEELQCDFHPYRDTEVLRSMKKLQWINGVAVKKFWENEERRQAAFDAWAKSVANLKLEELVAAFVTKMKELNPGFDSRPTRFYRNGVLTGLAFPADQVVDLAPVRALPGLQMLYCTGSAPGKGKLADLSPLKGLSLMTLSCTNTQVTDLSPLKELQRLMSLECDFKPERDTAILRAIPTLTTINGKRAAWLKPLSPKEAEFEAWLREVVDLRGKERDAAVLKKFKELNPDFKDTLVADGGNGLVPELKINGTNVTTLAPLRAYPELEVLQLGGPSKVSDLSPLRTMNLTRLDLTYPAVADLSPLRGMPLKTLKLGHAPVTDLSPLADMPLESLFCDFRPYRDTQVLRSLKTLKEINGVEAKEFWKKEGQRQAEFDAWAKSVAGLKPEEQLKAVADKLKELNPDFDGKILDSKSQRRAVYELHLSADNLTNLEPVRALSGLYILYCMGSQPGKGKLADLTPLKGLHLMTLNCTNTQVTDLSPLKDLPSLSNLMCDFKPERDIQILRNFPLLGTINGKLVQDLVQSASQKELEFRAWLQNVAAKQPAERAALVRAKFGELNPDFNGTWDVKKNEAGVLTELRLSAAGVTDLSALRACPELKVLRFTSEKGAPAPLSDLSPLRDLKLTVLDVENSSVVSLWPLKNMPLTSLFISDTPVADLSPLSVSRTWSLKTLSCARTAVADLSPVATLPLTMLDCGGSPVTELAPLATMPALEYLVCDFRPYRDTTPLRSLKSLKRINGVPVEEFWKSEDARQKEFDAWVQSIAGLKSPEQAAAVGAKLKERNPGFDGKVTPTTKDNVVSELSFLADNIADLSPVRALPVLRVLSAGSASGQGQVGGPVAARRA